ncbi:hypothetical protein [Levilactobacillus angrenensis]|uniref:Uncharacterized protein n=1 Tax=Levilactobacillus angrenensis TaxID=2486020 RepID=A0ABW1UBG5_9LACO|nr:hypothetical protein [Levilactobacillus angrenensis]
MKISKLTIDSSLKHKANYVAAYILGITTYLILILLNCRWMYGRFIFVWDIVSWYLTFSFVLIFPLECIVGEKLIEGHYRKYRGTPIALRERADNKVYYAFAGGAAINTKRVYRLFEIAAYSEGLHTVIDIFGIILGPVLLILFLSILMAQYYFIR